MIVPVAHVFDPRLPADALWHENSRDVALRGADRIQGVNIGLGKDLQEDHRTMLAQDPARAAQYLGLVGLDIDLHQVHRQVGTMLGQELVHRRDGDLALLQDIHLGGGLECAGALDQAGGGRWLEEICLALEVAQAQRKYVDPVLKPIPMNVLPQEPPGPEGTGRKRTPSPGARWSPRS